MTFHKHKIVINENSLFRDNLKKFRFLMESIDQKSIADAIKNNEIVQIYYQGDNTTNRGFRTIEPYTLGKSKYSDKTLLRAWQQAGATDTPNRTEKYKKGGPVINRGGWRLFDVNGISTWMPVLNPRNNFPTERDGYNPNDSHMETIYATHKIGSVRDMNRNKSKSIEQPKTFNINHNKNDFEFKKYITYLFGKEKFYGKRNPANFSVIIDDNGNLITKNNGVLRRQIERGEFDEKNIVGNLDELFKEISNLKDTKRVSKAQFEEFQDKLNNQGSLINNVNQNITNTAFFKNHYDKFIKDIKNN